MAVLDWYDLDPQQRREALLNLHRRDINKVGLPKAKLLDLLTQFNLLEDEQIRNHFKEEKIRLPHPVSKETLG